MFKRNLNYVKNIALPGLIFSFIAGTLTGAFIVLYRFAANKVINLSETVYSTVRERPVLVIPAVLVLGAMAAILAFVYKQTPNLKGGGIPTAIGILRGGIRFNWLKNLIGVTLASLSTFFVGVPLGSEGPSVQIGTAIGRGTVKTMAGKNQAWDRYVMTGGACAGFTAANNAPIAGIMFAIEEAHQRISPMIIMTAFSSVMFSSITVRWMCPLLGMDADMFPGISEHVRELGLSQLGVIAICAIVVGLMSVIFLRYFMVMRKFIGEKLSAMSLRLKIFIVFMLTFAFGLISYDFISTGHDLVDSLLEGNVLWYIILAILLYRATMLLAANNTGINGGMFVPIIALSALVASLVAKVTIGAGLISADYYSTIVVLGITAGISGMMKCPLTAMVFSIEALGCSENILPVILAAPLSYIITEAFGTESINEEVVAGRIREINYGKVPKVIDTFVTVGGNTFAVGKQIRDIFWPQNLFVLSAKHGETAGAEVDSHGDNTLQEGDILHVRYMTYDNSATKEELYAIVGEQKIESRRAVDV